MKLLVCISKAPDTTSKITFKDNNTVFNEEGVQFIVNPYDEWYALVRAIELKEKMGGSVTTISVGGADCDPIIRKALAIGADDAVRVNAAASDSFLVANEIAQFAKEGGYDIIFTGKETIDNNGAQIGGMVAELLDAAFVSHASKLEVDGSTATVEFEIQGGAQVAEVQTPFVVSAAKGMAEQRIPNMRGIMAARTKPLKVVEATSTETLTQVVEFTLPPAKAETKFINPENVEELVQLLHNEAKVL